MFKNKITFIISLFFVLGCAITGPDYEPPERLLVEEFLEKSEGVDSSKDPESNITWWQSFEDPELDALITKAAVENRDVLQAVSRINQSRALAREAFTELLPGAILNGVYENGRVSTARFPGGGDPSGPIGNFGYEVYTGSIDASWEIDIFGRLQRELEARNAEYDSSVAEVYDVLLMVISETGDSYLSLRSVQEQLKLARKNVALQKEMRDLTATKFEFGQVSELDLFRADTQVAQTRALIPELEALEKTHLHRLAVLTADDFAKVKERFVKMANLPKYNGPIIIGTPEDLLRRRPDLRIAERNLASRTARIGVALGELYPKITFTGAIGYEAAEFSDLTDGDIYRFGPSISWAALDSGRLRARVDVAEEATEEALLYFDQALQLALEDVENSLTNYSAEQRRLVDLENAFRSAERSYELARLQYNEGALDFLSVLDTQRTLLDTESAFVQSRERLSHSIVGIYKSIGGGWQAWEFTEEG